MNSLLIYLRLFSMDSYSFVLSYLSSLRKKQKKENTAINLIEIRNGLSEPLDWHGLRHMECRMHT